MINNLGRDASFTFEFTEETSEQLKSLLSTTETSTEITMGLDIGNGKIIQATGNLVNVNFKYKRLKRGKKYKLFRSTVPPFLLIQFISTKVDVCNE